MGLEHTVLGPFPRVPVAPAKASDRSSVYSTLLLYIIFLVPPQRSLRHSDHTGSEQIAATFMFCVLGEEALGVGHGPLGLEKLPAHLGSIHTSGVLQLAQAPAITATLRG